MAAAEVLNAAPRRSAVYLVTYWSGFRGDRVMTAPGHRGLEQTEGDVPAETS